MFKPLHVWSSKEATGNEGKKMVQNLKWATAHLSIGYALGARALGVRGDRVPGARQARAGGGTRHWARGIAQGRREWRRHAQGRTCEGARRRRAAQARRVGQQAVHLVHSACLT